jgi:hypothetical protein
MIQLYFLSVLFNGLAAYILIMGDGWEGIESSLRFSPRNPIFRLVLGILSGATGILKLLSPSVDNVPVFGDLVPSLAGIIAGFVLIFGYYRESASVSASGAEGKLDRMGDVFLKYKKGVGFVLLVAAALHFLFPQALFL